MKYFGFIILLALVSACSSPVHDFSFEWNGESSQVKLFQDSTFVSHVEKGEEQHSYAGYWSGNPSNGSFKTFVTRDGFDILEREIKFEYQMKDGRLVEFSVDTLPAKF